MRLLAIAILLFTSFAAHAAECVDQKGNNILNNPDAFLPLISAETDCYNASQLATACAWGSSLDIQTAGAAADVCSKELSSKKPSLELKALLEKMKAACNGKYEKLQGTLYLSENAFCQLSAIVWINDLASSDQN